MSFARYPADKLPIKVIKEDKIAEPLRWMDSCRTTIMKTDDLILEIQSLPAEERARIADCILRSLNQTVPAVDQKWADLATKRLHEIKADAVKPVAGNEVLDEIWRRLN
jgi:hypothetical protein